MCGGGTPNVVKRDPIAEQAVADRAATQKSNAELAYKRKQRQNSSLIANAGGAGGVSAIAQTIGKDKLG